MPFCQLGDCDGLDAAHTAAALGERFHLPHPKDTGQHLIDVASAASRFVCIQIAEMPLFTSWKATSCPLSFLRGEKMTGWWDTMSSQPPAAASSTTSG